jgi:hypothetical protein
MFRLRKPRLMATSHTLAALKANLLSGTSRSARAMGGIRNGSAAIHSSN